MAKIGQKQAKFGQKWPILAKNGHFWQKIPNFDQKSQKKFFSEFFPKIFLPYIDLKLGEKADFDTTFELKERYNHLNGVKWSKLTPKMTCWKILKFPEI